MYREPHPTTVSHPWCLHPFAMVVTIHGAAYLEVRHPRWELWGKAGDCATMGRKHGGNVHIYQSGPVVFTALKVSSTVHAGMLAGCLVPVPCAEGLTLRVGLHQKLSAVRSTNSAAH